MKIIHTADWHLGQSFYRYDREDEHEHFFAQLAEVLRREQPHALVVSGDIFHNPAPSPAAVKLFTHSLLQLHDASPQTLLVVTAGNHDSGTRLEASQELWQRNGIEVVGCCRRDEDGGFDPARFVLDVQGLGYVVAVPFIHPSNYPAAPETPREDRRKAFFRSVLEAVPDKNRPVVLMAHMAVDGCDTAGHEDVVVGGMLTEPLDDLGEGYDYLALGHIHKPQRIGSRAYYSGSPLPLSFSEDYTHYINIVTVGERGAEPEVVREAVEPLRRVRTFPPEGAPLEEALQMLADLDPADNSYIRLLVDCEGMLAPDAEDRARHAVEGKACRFCEVHRVQHEQASDYEAFGTLTEVEDFTVLEPLDIARRAYERAGGQPMRQELVDLFNQALSLSNSEDL